MVLCERNSAAPTSRFVIPRATCSAIWSSCGVSSSTSQALRRRRVSPLARSSPRTRSAQASAPCASKVSSASFSGSRVAPATGAPKPLAERELSARERPPIVGLLVDCEGLVEALLELVVGGEQASRAPAVARPTGLCVSSDSSNAGERSLGFGGAAGRAWISASSARGTIPREWKPSSSRPRAGVSARAPRLRGRTTRRPGDRVSGEARPCSRRARPGPSTLAPRRRSGCSRLRIHAAR